MKRAIYDKQEKVDGYSKFYNWTTGGIGRTIISSRIYHKMSWLEGAYKTSKRIYIGASLFVFLVAQGNGRFPGKLCHNYCN